MRRTLLVKMAWWLFAVATTSASASYNITGYDTPNCSSAFGVEVLGDGWLFVLAADPYINESISLTLNCGLEAFATVHDFLFNGSDYVRTIPAPLGETSCFAPINGRISFIMTCQQWPIATNSSSPTRSPTTPTTLSPTSSPIASSSPTVRRETFAPVVSSATNNPCLVPSLGSLLFIILFTHVALDIM